MAIAPKILTLLVGGFSAFLPIGAAAEPVSFPAYATVRNLDNYASETDYRAAVADTSFRMDRVTYRSDGLDVFAYVYRPANPTGTKLPVIIFNRGSWTWPSFHAELVTMANRLAKRGFLVVAPMCRGSGGAEGRDEMGGADLNDLFNLMPVIRALPEADAKRLYLYGESRGGMMTYQAIRDGFPARAAAVVGAFTDLDAMLADPQWAAAGAAIWPTLEAQRSAIVDRRSAQKWPEEIDVPVLILHGAQDRQVPVAHALQMATKLSAAGKAYQLTIVEGQGHTLAGRAADRDAMVADWFQRH